jgi:hypothetical protein
MPLLGPAAAAEGDKIARFGQKRATEGRFLCWRGGSDRLMFGFGTLRSRSIVIGSLGYSKLRLFETLVIPSFGYWIAPNVELHETRAHIERKDRSLERNLGLVLSARPT